MTKQDKIDNNIKLATIECVIYLITNLVNTKKYVGQTMTTFNKRYEGRGIGVERVKHYYETNGCKGNHHLYNSILKYGTENFKVEIIHIGQSKEELNYFEHFYERYYNTLNPMYGYNKKPCGDSKEKYHMSDEYYLKHYCFKYKKRIDEVEKFLNRRKKQKIYDGNECYNLFSTDIIYKDKRYKGLLSIPYKETHTKSIWKLYNDDWKLYVKNESETEVKIKQKRRELRELYNLYSNDLDLLYEPYKNSYGYVDETVWITNNLLYETINLLKKDYEELYKYYLYKCDERGLERTNENIYTFIKFRSTIW